MKILAIETIDVSASAALLEDENVLAAVHLSPEKRSAQFLAPTVRDLLESQSWKPADVDLTVIAQGPGSFTGLRVGIAFAKVFAYAAETDVIALNTLDLLAAAIPNGIQRTSVALDAQRGQVVARTYERTEDGTLRPVSEMEMMDWEDWVEDVPAGTYLSGPVLARKRQLLPEGVRTVPEECWIPSVEQMGKTAANLYRNGRKDDLWNLLPIYSRPAAAEERRMTQVKDSE